MPIAQFQNRNQIPGRGYVNDSREETNDLVNIELKQKQFLCIIFGRIGDKHNSKGFRIQEK